MNRPTVILASASPRRRELLTLVGIRARGAAGEHRRVVSRRRDAARSTPSGWRARRRRAIDEPDAVTIGSDTIVVVDGDVLGKPRDEAQAAEMLRRLSGRSHVVMTGVAVRWRGRIASGVEEVGVTFRSLSDDEIERYIDTGEPMDKAGAYGIQGFGATIVERVDGDYFAVMGLALNRLVRLCRELGLRYDFGPLDGGLIDGPPALDAIEHVAHRDARHAIEAILHA